MATRKRTPKSPSARPLLSAREARFCRAFVETGNATEAAERAGYATPTRGSLSARASWLLKKGPIRACIRRMQQEAADSEQATVTRIAQGLAHAAFADRTLIFDAKGRVLPPSKWPPEVRAIVTGFDVDEDTDPKTKAVTVRYKVKFERSVEAKKILAQWRRMIGQDAEAGATVPTPLVVGGEANPESL